MWGERSFLVSIFLYCNLSIKPCTKETSHLEQPIGFFLASLSPFSLDLVCPPFSHLSLSFHRKKMEEYAIAEMLCSLGCCQRNSEDDSMDWSTTSSVDDGDDPIFPCLICKEIFYNALTLRAHEARGGCRNGGSRHVTRSTSAAPPPRLKPIHTKMRMDKMFTSSKAPRNFWNTLPQGLGRGSRRSVGVKNRDSSFHE